MCIVFSRKQTNLYSTIALRNLISIARLLPLLFLSVSQTKLVYSRNIYCHSTTLHYPLLHFIQHDPRFVWPFLSTFPFDEWTSNRNTTTTTTKYKQFCVKILRYLQKKSTGKIREEEREIPCFTEFYKNTSQFGWSAYPFARIFLNHFVVCVSSRLCCLRYFSSVNSGVCNLFVLGKYVNLLEILHFVCSLLYTTSKWCKTWLGWYFLFILYPANFCLTHFKPSFDTLTKQTAFETHLPCQIWLTIALNWAIFWDLFRTCTVE